MGKVQRQGDDQSGQSKASRQAQNARARQLAMREKENAAAKIHSTKDARKK
jgi:hypothetical protein